MIRFYNSECVPVMMWRNVLCGEACCSFNLHLDYSIFKADCDFQIETKRLEEYCWGLESVSRHGMVMEYAHIDVLSEGLSMELERNSSMYIMTVKIQNGKGVELTVSYQISEAQISEVVENLKLLLNKGQVMDAWLPADCPHGKVNVCISNVSLHEKESEHDMAWMEFQTKVWTPDFDACRSVSMWQYELDDFREELLRFEEGCSDILSFIPLGEFYVLEFFRREGVIHMEGCMDDYLFPQSHLCFESDITMDELQRIFDKLIRIK